MLEPEVIWLIAGILLILAEIIVPGVVLVFFGFGAIITAITTGLGWTENFGLQSLVFVVSSVLLLFILRRLLRKWFVGSDDTNRSDMDDDFTGREARVVTDLPGEHGYGRVEIKGAEWKACSPEIITAGQIVIIDKREGLTLHVRPR